MKRLFEVDFEPVYPTGCGLIILADTKEEAEKMAKETVTHTEIKDVKEILMDKSKIVCYYNGDY